FCVLVLASPPAGHLPSSPTRRSSDLAPAPAAPVNVTPPVISGTAQVGQQLKASTGSWSNEPTSYAYEWLRCNSNGEACAAVPLATAAAYAGSGVAVRHRLRSSVVANN